MSLYPWFMYFFEKYSKIDFPVLEKEKLEKVFRKRISAEKS